MQMAIASNEWLPIHIVNVAKNPFINYRHISMSVFFLSLFSQFVFPAGFFNEWHTHIQKRGNHGKCTLNKVLNRILP